MRFVERGSKVSVGEYCKLVNSGWEVSYYPDGNQGWIVATH